MEIKTKYNIHDKVEIEDYVDDERVTCSVCDATGEVIIKGQKYTCPACNGKITYKKRVKKPITVEITDIVIRINHNQRVSIEYISNWSDYTAGYHSFYENDL